MRAARRLANLVAALGTSHDDRLRRRVDEF
jgi:hypothetical protein